MLLSWWLLSRRNSKLATGNFVAVVLRSYAMGLVTFLVYKLIPLGFLDTPALRNEVGLMAAICVHAIVVVAIYGAQFGLWLRFRR